MIRKRVFKLLTVFQVMILAVLLLSIGLASPGRAAAVRIMPLGDSITGSPGCWRALLWNRLQTVGFTNIDFVGTLPLQGCGVSYDGDNEGHGGILATNMADQNQLPAWLSATNPDIVLMHLGTNDVWSARSTTTILTAFSKLVDQMRANNPNVKILVAQIIPMDPARSCADCDQRVIALNNAIPGWATGKTTTQSPIYVVDQWTGFSTSTDTYDGVHPNDAGNQKISDKWYPVLVSFLAVTPTTPAPTTPPPTTPPATTPPPTTPPPAGVCQVAYTMNQWSNGFTADVKITNNGSTAISGWNLVWSFANGQQVTSSWNATVTQSGVNVTASNPASTWNGTIGANGGSVSFGFQATHTGTNAAPTQFKLNGVTCNGGTVTPSPTTPPPTTPPPTTPAACGTPLPVPSASLSVVPTALTVGQTAQVTFSSSNVGMPQYTLYDGSARIAVFKWGGGVDVYNESPLVRLVSGSTLPAVIEAVAPGTADLRVGANGEVIAAWYNGCNPSYTFTTVYSSSVPVSVSGTTPTTPPPTTPPPTTPPPPAPCFYTYANQNDWGNGATINVSIRYALPYIINGWTVTWTFPGNQLISNLWNGSFTQSGASVSVKDAGWNATIGASGGTVSFGFNLSYSGSNAAPARVSLNGNACQVMPY